MGESQSRYGIMESLNQQKLRAEQELAKLEAEASNNELGHADRQSVFEQQESSENALYKNRHEDYKRKRTTDIFLKEKDKLATIQKIDREIEDIKAEIADRESNYETEHRKHIEEIQKQKINDKEGYNRWIKLHAQKITHKKQEIASIQNAVQELKELSKETTKQ